MFIEALEKCYRNNGDCTIGIEMSASITIFVGNFTEIVQKQRRRYKNTIETY